MPKEGEIAAAAIVAVVCLTTCVDARLLGACQATDGLVLLQLDAPRLWKTASETFTHGAKNISLFEQISDVAFGVADPDETTAFSRAVTRLGLAVFIGGVAVALIAAYRFGTGKENMKQVVMHAGIWQSITIATAALIYVLGAIVTIPGYLVVFAFGTVYNTYIHFQSK
mmetsp:Transcript_39427/g.78016  ORF Transcript_39427/g.78016 Transcript_39427/m.78016 type:complete len:169 (-) Transcript_39427:112-618(-)